MGLRRHNSARLRYWLDADYPNRIQGRMPPETVLESRKFEGSVLLKKGAYDRLDDHYKAKLGKDEEGIPLSERDRDWHQRRSETDDVLLYLTDRYLREKADEVPANERARYYLMHRAMRQVCLSENTAGGFVELERLEKLGKNNYTIRTVADFARKAIEEILDELDRRDFRLEVQEDKRARDRYEAMGQDRRALMGVDDSYRRLAEERQELVCQGMSAKEATEKVAKNHDVSPRKVYRAVEFVREENKDEN